jgi:hypothetical protein
LFAPFGLSDLFAHDVPQTSLFFDSHENLAPRPIELEQSVESGLGMRTSTAEGGADQVGLIPDKSDIEHRDSPLV